MLLNRTRVISEKRSHSNVGVKSRDDQKVYFHILFFSFANGDVRKKETLINVIPELDIR